MRSVPFEPLRVPLEILYLLIFGGEHHVWRWFEKALLQRDVQRRRNTGGVAGVASLGAFSQLDVNRLQDEVGSQTYKRNDEWSLFRSSP